MDCAISRDGSLVVSASEDDTLRLWNVRGGNVIVFRVSLVKRSPQIRTKYTQSR
jgi:WD40 repeat protein